MRKFTERMETKDDNGGSAPIPPCIYSAGLSDPQYHAISFINLGIKKYQKIVSKIKTVGLPLTLQTTQYSSAQSIPNIQNIFYWKIVHPTDKCKLCFLQKVKALFPIKT